MQSPAGAILASWSLSPVVAAINLLGGLLYYRGWVALHDLIPSRFSRLRLTSFLCGLAALQIAIDSPIDAFDSFFLTDHMMQHLFLMMVVPPLILLANPAIPLMRGLPRPARRTLGKLFRWKPVKSLLRVGVHPVACWLAFSVSLLGWHLPRPYDLALRSPAWHGAEHITFLIACTLFWWPVIQPWPSQPRWPRWSVIPYLLLADFVNSALSAFLVFSGRVFYPFYLQVPRLWKVSVQNDQVIAGAVMWVLGSIAFLIPAVMLAARLLSPPQPVIAAPKGRHPQQTRIRTRLLPVLTCLLPLAVLAYGIWAPDSIDIDKDIVRMHTVSGQLEVYAFSPPKAFSAGLNELAVLVVDYTSGKPILDASVEISAGSNEKSFEAHATPQHAGNKLLQTAILDLPTPGIWNLRVDVRRGNEQALLESHIEVVLLQKGSLGVSKQVPTLQPWATVGVRQAGSGIGVGKPII